MQTCNFCLVKRVAFAVIMSVHLSAFVHHAQMPTQPSIPPASVNEYQLRLGRQRQVWFIPLADKAGCAGKTVRSLENACHT